MGIKKPFTTPVGVDLDSNATTLNFSSTAQRITGDMSTATIANRLFFQTNVSNGNTSISIIPNGTSGISAVSCYNNSDPTNASLVGFVTTTSTVRIQSTISGSGTYLPLTIFTAGSETARFDTSGNLGLGVTPSAWNSTYRALDMGSGAIMAQPNGSDVYVAQNAFYGTGPSWQYKFSSTAAARYQIVNGAHAWFTADSGTAGNTISFTQAMTLDASGNLGLGVTPSAWASTRKVVQLPDAGYFVTSGSTAFFATNVYADASVVSRYISDGFSTRYRQTAGEHQWATAPSGTAGNTISFSQVMTLDANGNMLLGTTSIGAQGISLVNTRNYSFSEGSGISYVNLFRQANSAATILANGYKTSSNANAFASSTDGSWAKSAIGLGVIAGGITFYADSASTVANGTDVTPTERARIDSNGNIVAGGSVALATTATNGFLYVPTCAGTPTGTPTAITGMSPIIVDSTNNKLYFYSGGAWRDAGP